MKNPFLFSFLFLLSACAFVACGSDDSITEASSSGKKNNTSGLFQINADGTKVYFSPGNLQATYNGSTWNWAFAKNQWDYIGNRESNIYINGNGTVSFNGTVDLFGWVGETSTWTGATQYGISNSITVNSQYTYGNIASESLKSDWGNTITDGYKWRTLSFSEWNYVLSTRTSGSTVNSTPNARYTLATINTDDRDVNGIILFPDDITVENNEATKWGKINSSSSWETKCTSDQWANLAAKGCAFLPAAGYRYSIIKDSYKLSVTVHGDGNSGYYWSSSPNTTDVYSAYAFFFDYSYLNPARSFSRPYGCSVRLVRVVE